MKSTSTKGPDSAVEGRRQNPGQIAKNIGERQSEPQSTAQLASLANIFAVWPRFLPSSPTAEPSPRLLFYFPSPDHLSARSPIWFFRPRPFFSFFLPPPPSPTNAEPGPRLVDAFLFSLKIKGLSLPCPQRYLRVRMVLTVNWYLAKKMVVNW